MDISKYYLAPGEQPLDTIRPDGGFFAILRTVACVGDSLASGEMESLDADGNVGYHDMYEYSWGQFMARAAGVRVLNYSRGGMTAMEYCQSFARDNGYWNPSMACQAYILALGVNDLLGLKMPLGSVADIDPENPSNNADTFAGWYARIIQGYKRIAPKAKFFLVGMPRSTDHDDALAQDLTELLYRLSEFFENTYVIDLFRYAPAHDEKFHEVFYMGGHLNAMGYWIMAQQIMSYIDFLIREKPEDFIQAAFLPQDDLYNVNYKW